MEAVEKAVQALVRNVASGLMKVREKLRSKLTPWFHDWLHDVSIPFAPLPKEFEYPTEGMLILYRCTESCKPFYEWVHGVL